MSPIFRFGRFGPIVFASAVLLSPVVHAAPQPAGTQGQAQSSDKQGDKQVPPNLQDGNALARLARVSRSLDRTLLRPSGDPPEGQATGGKAPRKAGGGGGDGGEFGPESLA